LLQTFLVHLVLVVEQPQRGDKRPPPGLEAFNRGDIDNFIKTVQDALQDAGVVADDAQIDSVSGVKLIDKNNPRIEIELIKR